jgi:hypothetical protein
VITRRKLFGLVAGAVVAPKELLAAPKVASGAITLEMLQKAYSAATFRTPPEYIFYYPSTPDECFVDSPRMNFKVSGFKIWDDKEEV